MQTDYIVRLHLHSIGLLQNESVPLVAGTSFMAVFLKTYDDFHTYYIGRKCTRYVAELVASTPVCNLVNSFIYYTTRLFFLVEIFLAFSFLVNWLYLISMKTNIFLLTGMCDHKYPTARKSHKPLIA